MPPKIKTVTSQQSINRLQIFHVNARRLLEHSTVHGLSHVSSASSRIGRTTWFLLFLTGIAGFCISLSLIVSQYVSRPVLTSHFTDHDEFVWPDITICNPSAPYVVHLYEREQKWLLLRDWAKHVGQNITSELFATIEQLDQAEIKIQALMHSTMSPTEFGVGIVNETVNFVGADIGHYGIILTVELDGNSTFLNPPIERYFRTQVLQKRYNIPCYTLQIGQETSDYRDQKVNKISLGIKFNIESHMIINTSYVAPTLDLFISKSGHVPSENPVELLPGYSHSIGLNLRRFEREPSKRPCRRHIFNAELFDADLVTKHPVHGSATLCHRVASQHLYIKYCGCYSPFLPYPVISDHPVFSRSPLLCFNMSRFKVQQLNQNAICMLNVFKQYRDPSTYLSLPQAKECEHLRVTPVCEEVDYKLAQARRTPLWELWSGHYNEARLGFLTSSFETVFQVDIAQSRLGTAFHSNPKSERALNYLRDNFALVSIERNLEKGELIKEELEYPLPELLSDIGGLMGLWIGISVIGLFEVMELCGLMGVTVVGWLRNRVNNEISSDQGHSEASRHDSVPFQSRQWSCQEKMIDQTDIDPGRLSSDGSFPRETRSNQLVGPPTDSLNE